MELIQVGENTYYIQNNTNIGVYKINENEVYLIDTGNDKDAGKKILKLIEQNAWQVKGIINTHSNADHIGGNKIIQERTACPIYAHNIEKSFIEYPKLEPAFLYGGFPFQELNNKFLLAKESHVTELDNNLPTGLEYFTLPGHFFDMIGIKTSDNIYFLADSIFSEETITKYHLFFIYDIAAFKETLQFLKTLNGDLYIPSHHQPTKDITKLIDINEKKVEEIEATIYNICSSKITFEDILQQLFTKYNLTMNENQYVLVGSTVRSYLSYLKQIGKLEYSFENNKMYWTKTKK